MLIRQRVALLAPDCDRFIRGLSREVTESMLRDGLVTVAATSESGSVSTVRLSGKCAVASDVRPGSFGIRREHNPVGRDYGLSGGVVYSHQRNLHDRVQA